MYEKKIIKYKINRDLLKIIKSFFNTPVFNTGFDKFYRIRGIVIKIILGVP